MKNPILNEVCSFLNLAMSYNEDYVPSNSPELCHPSSFVDPFVATFTREEGGGGGMDQSNMDSSGMGGGAGPQGGGGGMQVKLYFPSLTRVFCGFVNHKLDIVRECELDIVFSNC